MMSKQQHKLTDLKKLAAPYGALIITQSSTSLSLKQLI